MRIVIALILVVAACRSKPKLPEHVLPKEKMGAIMLDLIHTDGKIANAQGTDTLLKTTSTRYRMYQQVLALHQTNQQQFAKSLKYYEQHPTLLKEVFAGMESTLNKQMADTTRKNPNKKRPLAL